MQKVHSKDNAREGSQAIVCSSCFESWIISLAPAMPDHTYKLLTVLGEVKDTHVCEIGCGTGILTKELAKRGAHVSASDISEEAVKITRETMKGFNPISVNIQQMDACNLLYNDESFDLVVGMAVLHHLNLTKAAKEISRVLKPNSKAVFIEPLSYNPIVNLWRKLTPNIRVPDEHPLSYSNINEMGKHFKNTTYSEYGLLPLLSSLVYLITFSDKAKEKTARVLERIEPTILKSFKPLRKYSGAVVIEFSK